MCCISNLTDMIICYSSVVLGQERNIDARSGISLMNGRKDYFWLLKN